MRPPNLKELLLMPVATGAKRKRGEQWEMVVSGYALLPVGVQPQTTLTGTPQ